MAAVVFAGMKKLAKKKSDHREKSCLPFYVELTNGGWFCTWKRGATTNTDFFSKWWIQAGLPEEFFF